jgi:hypothetical protein
MLVQAVMLGAAAELLLRVPNAVWLLAAAALAQVLLLAAEIATPHPTAHARAAAHELTAGRYARWFWPGAALVALAVAAPWLGPAVPVAAVAALAGTLANEHAYVQAGQSVPLA